jgi:hypothetical protein
MTRWDVSAGTIANIIRMANFIDTDAEEILKEIHSCGSYGEEGDDCWMVFGEYEDDTFTLGY